MNIGEWNQLTVLRFTAHGSYLSDEEGNEVLLPNKYVERGLVENDKIDVFVYRDSEDRMVATTLKPLIELNGFSYLKVKQLNFYGAFVDWGLEKDLMIPFKEQKMRLEEGQSYLTCLLLDEATNRLYGTTKVGKHIQSCSESFDASEPVEALICDRTDLGVRVIINNRYAGLVYSSDIIRPVRRGDLTKAYVYNVREDGKLDVRLEPQGMVRISESAERLLEILKKKGKLNIHDKSDPEIIRETVGMSKKTFKQAVGGLYKQRLITLEPDGIVLNDTTKD